MDPDAYLEMVNSTKQYVEAMTTIKKALEDQGWSSRGAEQMVYAAILLSVGQVSA